MAPDTGLRRTAAARPTVTGLVVLLLASASPRRAELLRSAGIAFEVRSVDLDESVQPDEPAEHYVERVALRKALAAVPTEGLTAVLAADTCLELDGEILGKPRDKADFQMMMRRLSGRTHRVLSAIALREIETGEVQQLRVDSRVTFRPLDEFEIEQYWATGEPLDKAGGYAIQGLAAAFVRQLQGSYSAVVGLPLCETLEILESIGVFPAWKKS